METLGLSFFISELFLELGYPRQIQVLLWKGVSTMLKNIKKHVLKAIYNYHYHMTNHYGCFNEKGLKHIHKEFELVNKLVQM